MKTFFSKNQIQLIAMGASTGGTEALLSILEKLPADLPPIVITQHMPPVFTQMYAERLDKLCQMEVREGKNQDRLYPGLCLVAPGGLQMQVVRDSQGLKVECKEGEKVSGHCPSIDFLFSSVARECGNHAIGIILTGMGKDGANGLLAMHEKGAFTIGQDRQSSIVYGMPMEAYKLGAVDRQGNLSEIATLLINNMKEGAE